MAQPSTDYIVFTGDKLNEGYISRIPAPEAPEGKPYCLKLPCYEQVVVFFKEACVRHNEVRQVKGECKWRGESGQVELLVCSPTYSRLVVKTENGFHPCDVDSQCMESIFAMLAADNPWIAKTFGMAPQQQ